MKKIIKNLILFLVVIAGFGLSKSYGQCSASFNQGASVNISYCASSCGTETASVTVSCATGSVTSWTFEAKGGITKINQTNTTGSNVYTVTYSSLPGSFCKGRLTFKFSTAYCVDKLVSMDVFKCFSKTDLNTAWNTLYGTATGLGNIGYEVIGPNCAKNGELVTFSVTPLLSCSIADEIGVDDYVWNFPNSWGVYNSTTGLYDPIWAAGDKSSITLVIPANYDWSQNSSSTAVITCKLGKCNTSMSPLPRKQVIQAPKQFWLTFSSSNNTKAYYTQQGPGTAVTGYACVDADFGSNTTDWIQISGANSPVQPEWEGKWQWNVPDGFDVVNASGGIITTPVTASTIRVRPRPGSAGANGIITGTIDGASCLKSTNSFIIHRKLVSTTYNQIWLNNSSSNVCLRAGTAYVARVNNGPAIPYTWTFSGLTTNSNGTASATTVNTSLNELTLYPLNGATSATLNVLGNNTLPQGVSGSACNNGSATTFPATLSFPGTQGQTVDANFSAGTNSFSVTGIPSSCTPQATHFNFSWAYTGWVAQTNNPLNRIWVINATTANVPIVGVVQIFEDPSTGGIGSGVPTPKLRSGFTYCGSSSTVYNPSTAATASVTVTNKPTFPGGSTCTLDCFLFTKNTISISGGNYLPGNGGGGDNPQQLFQPYSVPTIHLMPNPAPGKFQIQLEGTKEMKGSIEVINASGVVVYKTEVNKNLMEVDLHRKGKGLYSVRWINEVKPVTQTLILE